MDGLDLDYVVQSKTLYKWQWIQVVTENENTPNYFYLIPFIIPSLCLEVTGKKGQEVKNL